MHIVEKVEKLVIRAYITIRKKYEGRILLAIASNYA